MNELETGFKKILAAIVENDTNYDARARLVYGALAMAATLNYPAGIRIDPAEPAWPVIFIELPGAGQVSWHMPQHPHQWDGHTTPEKFNRIAAYCELES